MKLVIAEKPSVAQSLAKVIGANQKKDGYMEGNGYIVSWCVGLSWQTQNIMMRNIRSGARKIYRFSLRHFHIR